MFGNLFPEYRAVYDVKWKNIVQQDRPRTTIWCMRIACCITKATNTHSVYVTIIAFPLQQWLRYTPQCYVIRTFPIWFFLAAVSKLGYSAHPISYKSVAMTRGVAGGEGGGVVPRPGQQNPRGGKMNSYIKIIDFMQLTNFKVLRQGVGNQ